MNDIEVAAQIHSQHVRALDCFVNVRIHRSIPIIELDRAAAAIGCVLEADPIGLKISKREIKEA